MIQLISDILKAFSCPKDLSSSTDHLNSFVSVSIFFFLTVVIGTKQYFLSPLQCWIPHNHPKAWEQYAENYCFVQNTYFLPKNVSVDGRTREQNVYELSYYQWAPFILLGIALTLYVPRLIWHGLNSLLGANIDALYSAAVESESVAGNIESVRTYCKYFSVTLSMIRSHRGLLKHVKPRYLTGLYLVIKFMYAGISVGLFYMLNALLGTQDTMYGWSVFRNLMAGRDWQVSGVFPRVTFCDYRERRIENTFGARLDGSHGLVSYRTWTVQCVLSSNILNEKIFVFAWFFLAFLALVNCLVFLLWTVASLFPPLRVRFIRPLIKRPEHLLHEPEPDHLIRSFVSEYVQLDGVLLVRLIEGCCGTIAAAQAITWIWGDFLHEKAICETRRRLKSVRSRTKSESAAAYVYKQTLGIEDDDTPPVSPSALQLQHMMHLDGRFAQPEQEQDPGVKQRKVGKQLDYNPRVEVIESCA